jgi:predicted AlkP superfamily phosphohydrolase/phosphomutase
MKKAIVLGFDGFEPSIVDSLIAQGRLPHFARLREQGAYSRLKTTYPAQTPVAWSSFATGTNPGGHGIFDFIRRDVDTYEPDLALSRHERPKNVFSLPKAVSMRRGEPFWNLLTQAGIENVILRCPCCYPPDAVRGRMLAGVGTPDVRGGQGTGTFYTQDCAIRAGESEQVIHLDAGDEVLTHVVGPRNARQRPAADTAAELRVRVERAARKLILQLQGATLELAERAWSPWARVKFKLSMLQSVTGIVRFYLRSLEPCLEFYATAVNFEPAHPLFPITSPPEYGAELAERIGFFSTLGMAEDHNGLENGRLDEAAYQAQCELTLAEREKMAFFELERFTRGFFCVVFDTPDRFQHMFWRFRDRRHPLFDEDSAREFGGLIEEHYVRYDRLLGRALEYVDGETLLIVLSDHGFNTFRRAFDTNMWLRENGLLALRGDRGIDWPQTRAYAMGLGGIYLNRKGREREGIVEDGAGAERVSSAIEKGLRGLRDPATGCVAIHSVCRREHLYSGAYISEAPDLLVNFAPGYRVSWESALGKTSGSSFQDNLRRWSGDHIVDPMCVPGIVLLNRPAELEGADIRDIAPTVLKHFGVAPHAAMEGRPLL